ncbi:sensor histidine kinase [Aureibaculum luteum]|uniref:sensor histidine kinase n=1 Tax=Aureibaculum luteum TaxID=1548456 RepID=UPI0018E5A355|nr:ATP-binding protein [Aureibaculum luteum]
MKHYIFLLCLVFGLFLISCQKNSKSKTETTIGDYKTPETIPLVFTEPEPFEWETITNDTLTIPVTYSLDVDALPSKPFELNTFKPLKSPMKEYDLDWDNVSSEKLKLDSVPFTVTKSAIKKPTITKMKTPAIMEGTHTNLMQLSVNEGLPANEISSMVETEDGNIWIASSSTTGSLTLYDGENAFAYDYTSVYGMTFDKQGRLWLTTVQNGIYVLDFKNDIEYVITPSVANFIGVDILCDYTGTLYFVSYGDGIFKVDAEMKNLQKLEIASTQFAFTLFEDSQNNIWLSTDDGLAMLDKERESLKKMPSNPNNNLNAFVFDMTEDKTGNIWICQIVPPSPDSKTTTYEVLQVSLKNKKITVLSAENGYNIQGREIEEDNQGNFWIAGTKEIFILSNDKKSSKTVGVNSNMTGDQKRTRSLKRKDGSLWFGTVDKGVIIANDFTLKTEYFDDSSGLIDDEVWEIEENSRGEIWLGTTNGINIIDPKKNTIKALSPEKLHGTPNNQISIIRELSKDIYYINTRPGFSIFDRQKNKISVFARNAKAPIFVVSMAVVNEHTFLLYTSQGIFFYDIENNSLNKVVSKNDSDILNAERGAVMVYNKEILWIPTQNGLARVNIKTNNVSYLREEQGLCDNNAMVVSFSKEGELWVATLNGISILNLEENTLTNLKEENGLLPSEMYDLIERDDIMYAASVNGLIPIEKATVKTTNNGFYNFNSGLGFKLNDYLQNSPKFLKNGQFWAGISNSSDEYKLLIIDNEPKPDSIVNTVHITKMYVRDEAPRFNDKNDLDSLNSKISSFSNETNLKWDSIKQPYNIPSGLVLPFDQNSLSFSYASNNVFNRAQLTYRFILDGEDADWTYADTKTKTKNYYNLKPGQYTFKVAARSFNKQWSKPDVLTFRISPPWWQTWWAYLLFGLLAVGILRIYILFRARKLTNENKLLEEKVKERTNELEASIEDLKATQSQLIQSEKMASLGELTAGIAHEIQNPLNFVNNFSEINVELIDEMQEELKAGNPEEAIEISNDIKENQKKINHHGKRADSIVKGMLKHSRNTSGEKEPTNINAIADEYLRLAYHGLRAKDKSFNATLNTDFDESIGLINVAGQDMGRVILNLITNALHAISPNSKTPEKTVKDPTIWISTKKVGDQVIIKIKDNGSGIPKEIVDKIFQPFFTTKPSGQGTGLGLSMSYDIVRSHGGDLKVESQEGEGTTFTISIPK